MSTAFVTLCDAAYFPKAERTIYELRTFGRWTGDIVLVAVDFDPPPRDDVIVMKTSHLPTDALCEAYAAHPLTKGDGRHLTRLYQWDKLQVFRPMFRRWDRIVFVDAGLRIFNPVHPLLALEWKGRFLSPDDTQYPPNPNLGFRSLLDEHAQPEVFQELLRTIPPAMLSERFFVSALFVYDTSLLERIRYEDLVEMMNRYPIGVCNDMWLLNLVFTIQHRVWTPLPKRLGSHYTFGYNESGANGTPGTWRDFVFVKYPFEAPPAPLCDPSTVVVSLTDASYMEKAHRTLTELQTKGQWYGDTVLLCVDVDPPQIPGVQCVRIHHLDTSSLLAQWKTHPIRPMPDNRHYGKQYQWDKLQVFAPYFRQWKRVVFLDAGLRIFDSLQPLLDLEWQGKFLAPDDADPYDNGVRFRVQLDLDANPTVTQDLFTTYPVSILDEHYFLNCIFVYDTDLLRQVSLRDLETAMNAYPICMCNEMGILNLLFTFKLRVWHPFPIRVGSKYLFGWSERNYREGPSSSSFHFLKYSLTA